MSQRVIDVTLTVLSDVDVLVFGLDDKKQYDYTVNLNSATSQNELKNVFSRLLQLLLQEDIILNLVVKAKLFCPEIAGLFCRIAGLFCHDSRANLSLKPVCFGIAIS